KGCPKGSIPIGAGQSIQKAIDAAPCTGAVLCVAPGTYTGLINFHGKPVNLLSSGGPGVTFLDGGGSGPVVTFASAEGKDSILNGFTVRNGKAAYGAGIYINGASPSIRNSIVSRNAAVGGSGKGGGIGVTGVQANPLINCTQFLGNSADYSGGGLESTYSSNPYLRSDYFEGNKAPYGAAIGVAWSARSGSRTTPPVAMAAACGWRRASRRSSTPRSTATGPQREEVSRQATAAWWTSRARCSSATRRPARQAPRW